MAMSKSVLIQHNVCHFFGFTYFHHVHPWLVEWLEVVEKFSHFDSLCKWNLLATNEPLRRHQSFQHWEGGIMTPTWIRKSNDSSIHYLQELPPPRVSVTADKGYNFSQLDDAFIAQKKNHFQLTCQVFIHLLIYIQGDTSGWLKPPVDIDLKVAFYW